jgi:hypothetical protein
MLKSVLHCILSQASAGVQAVMILRSSFLLCHGALLFLILSVLRARQIFSCVRRYHCRVGFRAALLRQDALEPGDNPCNW